MRTQAALFKNHRSLRAVIEACLQGRAGSIKAVGDRPSALRLDVGCYAIFGGDAEGDEAGFLIESTDLSKEFVYVGATWERRIQAHFSTAQDASMMTFVPGPSFLEQSRRYRDGLHPDFKIETLQPGQAVNESLKPNGFQVYGSSGAFFEYGFGLWVSYDGRMVALATTYTGSSDKAEIAIATDPAYRNKGLATSLAGAMVHTCASRGLEPHWSASNPVSQRIALRVGFIENYPCRVLKIP